jgi:hypothetical protein
MILVEDSTRICFAQFASLGLKGLETDFFIKLFRLFFMSYYAPAHTIERLRTDNE